MTFVQFIFYGIGAAIAPRFTIIAIVIDFTSGAWAVGLCVWCAGIAWEQRKVAAHATYFVNLIHHALTGRQLIVDRVVEKIVEKPVEKIVERVRTITKTVVVKDMSQADAASALGCSPGAPREKLAAGYKAMMKKVHPDHGGSAYLATLVNQARTMLLK